MDNTNLISWKCPRCEILNAVKRNSCHICGNIKPSDMEKYGIKSRIAGFLSTEYEKNTKFYEEIENDGQVTTCEWFWRIVISCIPVVGIIMLFVWAFGNNSQPSLKTWARAQLILMLISSVVIIFFTIISSAVITSIIKG